jgi:effector-binding domain-containing protein
MNVSKKLLIILASLVGLFLVVTLLLPSKYTVTRSIKINAPARVVFEQVNNVKNWVKWSPWYKMDPSQKFTFSGPAHGSGACYSWESLNKNVGNGSLTITQSQPYAFINTRVITTGAVMEENPWTFKEDNGVTEVTQSVKVETSFFGRWAGLFMDASIGPLFEKSLANLKEVSEAAPKVNIKISMTDAEPQTILAINETTSLDKKEISEALGRAFTEINEFMKRNNLQMAGPPLAINNSYDGGRYNFDAGIPIKTTKVTTTGRIKLMMTPPGRVVKGIAVGPSDQSDIYYQIMEDYIKENNLKLRGKSWEVYLSDPAVTPAENLVTHIYYPIYVPE